MAELSRLSVGAFKTARKLPVSLILDNIRSANNVGSIFRTADCFALRHVYLCGITAQPPHRDILKTALGATESVDWSFHEDVFAAIAQARRKNDTALYALEQTVGSLPLRGVSIDTNRAFVLVVGNEVQGVQQEVIDVCDGCVEIEQFGTKHSLNVAVATGLAIYEVTGRFR